MLVFAMFLQVSFSISLNNIRQIYSYLWVLRNHLCAAWKRLTSNELTLQHYSLLSSRHPSSISIPIYSLNLPPFSMSFRSSPSPQPRSIKVEVVYEKVGRKLFISSFASWRLLQAIVSEASRSTPPIILTIFQFINSCECSII